MASAAVGLRAPRSVSLPVPTVVVDSSALTNDTLPWGSVRCPWPVRLVLLHMGRTIGTGRSQRKIPAMQTLHQTSVIAATVAMLLTSSCGGSNSPAPVPVAKADKAPLAPAAKDVETRINSKGLREDREIDYPKPAGRMRIVCVGGSITLGDGVAQEETFEAWMQKNMRGRGYDVEVLNAGKPGFGAKESADQLESELLKYEPDLVVVSIQDGEGTTSAVDLQRIETLLGAKKIVYILLAVPELTAVSGYAPKPPAVYVVPSKAALDVFADKNAILDTKGRWTEFAHQKTGNALAELIVGAPLICCAQGPVPANPQ